MQAFLPTELEDVALYSRRRLPCPKCLGARYLTPPGELVDLRSCWVDQIDYACEKCEATGNVDFGTWAVAYTDDKYAVSLLVRTLRALGSHDVDRRQTALACVDALLGFRAAADNAGLRFFDFCTRSDEWDRLSAMARRMRHQLEKQRELRLAATTREREQGIAQARELHDDRNRKAGEWSQIRDELHDKYPDAF